MIDNEECYRISLHNKRILFGLTFGKYMYKSIDLVKRMCSCGANVSLILSSRLLERIDPSIIEYVTECPILGIGLEPIDTSFLEEIDAMVVAPADLEFISGIAYGVSVDDPLIKTAIAINSLEKPLAILPVIEWSLYNSLQYRDLEDKLKNYNVYIIDPLVKNGELKYPPLGDLLYCISTLVERRKDLVGYNAIVTTGSTIEYLDPLRIITNKYRGLVGLYIALELACRGSRVHLVYGPSTIDPPYNVVNYPVETTHEMAARIRSISEEVKPDIAVFAASPADYRPISRSSEKISTRIGEVSIKLRPTVKTVKALRHKPRVSIGFAFEVVRDNSELIEKAKSKLEDYRFNIVVGINTLSRRGASSCIVKGDHVECFEDALESMLARRIVDLVVEELESSKS